MICVGFYKVRTLDDMVRNGDHIYDHQKGNYPIYFSHWNRFKTWASLSQMMILMASLKVKTREHSTTVNIHSYTLVSPPVKQK